MPDAKDKPPDTAMLDAELQDAIQAAIDSLPETQRMAIILRWYDQFSYEEIGDILKLSVPAGEERDLPGADRAEGEAPALSGRLKSSTR